MAERNSSGLMMMMMMMEPSLPAEVREKLAELELELSEGKVAASFLVSFPHTHTHCVSPLLHVLCRMVKVSTSSDVLYVPSSMKSILYVQTVQCFSVKGKPP